MISYRVCLVMRGASAATGPVGSIAAGVCPASDWAEALLGTGLEGAFCAHTGAAIRREDKTRQEPTGNRSIKHPRWQTNYSAEPCPISLQMIPQGDGLD